MRRSALKKFRSSCLVRLVLTLLLGFSVVSFSSGSSARSAGNPFPALKGWWKGPGTVSPGNGAKERVICRVTYKLSGNGRNISQKINCAGTDFRFKAVGDLKLRAGKLTGSFIEERFNVSGQVSGSVRSSGYRVNLTSKQFKGRLSVTLRGKRKHTITISQFDAELKRYIPRATITLRR